MSRRPKHELIEAKISPCPKFECGVPDRAEFGCDWPYAVRRYNGSGPDSYHYQTTILLKLAAMSA